MDNNERRLHDAKLGAAIENAAGKLPDGYLIRVEIESGSATVAMEGPDAIVDDHFYADTLADQINDAVTQAIGESEEVQL